MPQSLTDTINLIASLISIIGGMISIGGVFYKWRAKPGPIATTRRKPQQAPPRQTPAPSRQPVSYPPVKASARRTNHPVILGFSATGLLAVIIYSIELLVSYSLSMGRPGGPSTGLPSNSPLINVNAALIVVNLACVVAVTVGVAATAYRARNWAWLTVGAIALVVSLCTIGIFSVVAFAPGVFYGVSGPHEPDAWGA